MSVLAQNTYIITGSGAQFTATKNGTAIQTNRPLQSIIDVIKSDAAGAACTIQFENGTNTLNTGTNSITFNGGVGGTDWGLITLTGKMTSSCSDYSTGPVYLINGVSINSKADITNTGVEWGNVIHNNSTGTLTVSGGTLLATGPGEVHAIFNESSGTVNVTGGTISVTGDDYMNCAIYNESSGTINVSGGTISKAGSRGNAIFNTASGAIIISGGTINATCDIEAVYNIRSGTIEVSGGTIAAKSWAIKNEGDGTIDISGGTISTAEDYYTLFNYDPSGTITVRGGTITGIKTIWGNAGMVNISGGMILAKEGYAIRHAGGTITISGGIVFAYGKNETDVIEGGVYTQNGNAVIIAWNKEASPLTYAAGTSNDIFKSPAAASALWAKQDGNSGIAVKYGATDGFIPIAGVTVTGVSIEDDVARNVCAVYPNPTSGELRIENGELRIENVEIFDVYGRNVGSKFPSKNLEGWQPQADGVVLDISHFPAGIYFVKIHTESGMVTKKVVKE